MKTQLTESPKYKELSELRELALEEIFKVIDFDTHYEEISSDMSELLTYVITEEPEINGIEAFSKQQDTLTKLRNAADSDEKIKKVEELYQTFLKNLCTKSQEEVKETKIQEGENQSLLSGSPIDKEKWSVSVVRAESSKQSEEVFLIIEGIKNKNQQMIGKYSIASNTNVAEILEFNKKGPSPLSQQLIMSFFSDTMLKGEIGKYYYQSWNVDKSQAQSLRENFMNNSSGISDIDSFTWIKQNIENSRKPIVNFPKKLSDIVQELSSERIVQSYRGA